MGQRLGQLVHLPLAQLQALLSKHAALPDWNSAAHQSAAQALLDCLTPGTPAPNVLQAVAEFNVQVVAISVSAGLAPTAIKDYAQALSHGLPATCHLWFGGQGSVALAGAPHARWTLMNSTSQAVATWALLARSHATL